MAQKMHTVSPSIGGEPIKVTGAELTDLVRLGLVKSCDDEGCKVAVDSPTEKGK